MKKQPIQISTKKEIRNLAKRVNDSFYRLEKKGLAKQSKAYQGIKKQASADTSGMYTRAGDKPRLTRSTKHLTSEAEAQRYKKKLEKMLKMNTIKVSGVKAAREARAQGVRKTTARKRAEAVAKQHLREALGLPQPAYKPTPRLEAEIKKKVRKINQSLKRLEDAGLQSESAEYNMIAHYAIEKESPFFNYKPAKGTIRATTDLSRFEDPADLYRYNEVLNGILNAQTRTVTGTREAIAKRKQTFEDSELAQARPDLTFDQFRHIMQIYRTKVVPDRNNHLASDRVVQMIRNTDMNKGTLSDDDLADGMRYELGIIKKAKRVQLDRVTGTWEKIRRTKK